MRWLKHMTGTADDERVAVLLASAGATAYGTWWLVLEVIASRMDRSTEDCQCSLPASIWAAKLHCRRSDLRARLEPIVSAGLLEEVAQGPLDIRSTSARHPLAVRNDPVITLRSRNLLKYRDEYTKKSGESPDNVRSKQQQQLQHSSDTATAGKNGAAGLPKTILGNTLPAFTITAPAGGSYDNPEWIRVRDALRAAEPRIRSARNPQLYERKIIEREWLRSGT